MSKLALLGGRKVVSGREDLFSWPVVTPRMEAAVLEVLRKGKISDLDITVEFEKEFARWLGVKYALAHNTGTAAVHCALFGLGIGRGG
jgi:perosamine synthetase